MAALLADVAVATSVALQCGTSARAMARSVSRVAPADGGRETAPISLIDAALDLLARYEAETA